MSWENHISTIKARTTNAIRNIARTSNILSQSSRKLLSEALITPHYNYCDVIYDGCSQKAKLNLQRNQNYAAKALLGKSKFSSGSEALKELNWLPLEQRRKLHTAVFVHKAMKGKTSEHGMNMVNGLRPKHNHRMRQVENQMLHSLTHSTKQVEKSITCRAIKVWNDVPVSLKKIENSTSLKNKWQGLLIDAYQTNY